jgi:hypothetical protein
VDENGPIPCICKIVSVFDHAKWATFFGAIPKVPVSMGSNAERLNRRPMPSDQLPFTTVVFSSIG